MVVIPPGKFSMGSPDDELDRTAGEGPRHAVTIPYAFAVSRSEITFDQWDACVAAKACPPAKMGNGARCPQSISAGTAPRPMLLGCRSSPARTTGCRARPSGNMRPAPAPIRAMPGETRPATDMPIATAARLGSAEILVGSFEPNAFGLLDMEGNVWEWVEDVWHARFEGAPVDGSAWIEGGDATFRTIRGGSWHNEPELIRSAVRFERHRKVQFDTLGLRVARSIGR